MSKEKKRSSNARLEFNYLSDNLSFIGNNFTNNQSPVGVLNFRTSALLTLKVAQNNYYVASIAWHVASN